ncbi:DAK2 domain-containing protein [Gordonia sp. CPCC 205515]|uniref:DAK2 domain-containing protein n=1 Tax=Gordonia sp. CPCC 205515 TaxID=3140791 RepID=UPI003AF34D97
MEPVFDGGASRAMDPQLLRDWARAAADNLATLRGEINDLNVFPIPDSDTGSNMLSTMQAAADAAASAPAHAGVPTVAREMADGAVASARGNSGVILSQVLVGMADAAEALADEEVLGFNRLMSGGLRLGARAAVRAVSEPREGTVLTLVRIAAETAAAHVDGSPAGLARAVADECAEGLEMTPEQLPELASAGVVDAGARGFLVLADAMVQVLTGVANRRRRYHGILQGGGEPGHQADETCSGGSDMDFEVMYLLEGAAEQIGPLRDTLNDLGDAVVIVGDNSSGEHERFSVHVHTCEPGKAVEAGVVRGTVSEIRISCFALDAIRLQVGPAESPPRHKRAVVAVVTGDGAAELFAEAGAVVVRADAGLKPTTLAEAIRNTDSAHIVVMANGKLASQDIVTVTAEARSPLRAVVNIPTSSMVQCLSALAVHDPSESPDADSYAMAEAAAGTRWGSLVRARAKMMTLAGTCEVGDMLGLIGSDVLVISADQTGAATALIDLMLATGGELVTVLAGADVDDEVLEAITVLMRRNYQGVELAIYRTGQSDQVLQVGVE